jgi:hypothetical protein
MPTNHRHLRDPRADKARDMSRAVLPSTRPKPARRRLAQLRRQHRREVRAALRSVGSCVCDAVNVECPLCNDAGWVAYPLSEHLEAIVDRRAADKLGPLLRWGSAHADRWGDSAESRLRALLPDGAIGGHAMSHLVGAGVVESGPPAWWRTRTPAVPMPWRDVLTDIATWALTEGDHHRALHRLLVAHPATGPGASAAWADRTDVFGRVSHWRPLRGIHDVEQWADDVCGWLGVGPWGKVDLVVEWARALGWSPGDCVLEVRLDAAAARMRARRSR